ncbi:11841_t:CDS:2, partial [Funneliformis caledonium]
FKAENKKLKAQNDELRRQIDELNDKFQIISSKYKSLQENDEIRTNKHKSKQAKKSKRKVKSDSERHYTRPKGMRYENSLSSPENSLNESSEAERSSYDERDKKIGEKYARCYDLPHPVSASEWCYVKQEDSVYDTDIEGD